MARIIGTNNRDLLRGTNDADQIDGLDGDDIIFGRRGNDEINGGQGNDRIFGGPGDNKIDGGEGDDRILGGRDSDEVNGGEGNDRVWTRVGDDVAIYNVTENIGSTDFYDGGHGVDTLRLILTSDQFNSAEIQEDIQKFQDFLAQSSNSNSANQPFFTFSSFDLTVRNWENLEVVIVDEPEIPAVSINDITLNEAGETADQFTVSLSEASVNDVTVSWALSTTTLSHVRSK